jgi:hypothetical protein
MTRRKRLEPFLIFCLFLAGAAVLAADGQAPDRSKILGNWSVEVDAGGEYYYLGLVVAEEEGRLAGRLSEQSGYFSGVPLRDILFDGKTFSFKCTAPTPPDGMENTIQGEFDIGEDELTGSMTVVELDITAFARAKRINPPTL